MYGADHAVMARLLVLARVDPEAAGPIGRLEAERASGMATLAGRLAAAGRLRPELSTDAAAHTLAILTSFWTFDELHAGRGLGADACADLLVELARATLLRQAT
jgi:hypothetical protein